MGVAESFSLKQRYADEFAALLAASSEELEQWDIARMQLLCAHGLPGAEDLDIEKCLATIDEWTEHVRAETERIFPDYLRNPNPKKGSEAVYRLWAVIKTLKDSYNLKHYLLPEKGTGITGVIMESPFAKFDVTDSGKLFIHGLLGSRRIGSCSSLPVLFAAVARRLGYPVKIVMTVQHMFVRWESPEESFNIEGTGPDYISLETNEHYINSPRPWTKAELASSCFLRSCTAAEELAAILLMRSGCLRYNGFIHESYEMCQIAHKLSPENPAYISELETIRGEMRRNGIRARPSNRPTVVPLPPLAGYSDDLAHLYLLGMRTAT